MRPGVDHDELGKRLLAVADSRDESDWGDVLERAGVSPGKRRMREALTLITPRRLAVTVGAIAAAVAAVIATTGGGSSSMSVASAATVLNQAAARSDGYGLRGPIPDGKFWYQKYETRSPRRAASSVEKWISRSGSGRWRIVGKPSLDVRFPSASWQGARTRSHITLPTHGIWQPYPITGRELTYAQMLRLPTDPDALRRLLAPKSATPGSLSGEIAFENIAGLLEQPALPAKLRSGLFRTLALIHNVQNLGSTTVDDQVGTIVGIIQGQTLQEVIVNAKTGLLLGGRAYVHASITQHGSGRPTVRGTLTSQVILTASGVVGSISRKTTAICWSATQPCTTRRASTS